MSSLTKNVLVLNKLWQAVDVTTVFDAMCKVFQGKAVILDDNCIQYGWQEWVETWEDASKLATVMAERLVRTPSCQFPAPEIIILKRYEGYRKRGARPCRSAIYKRDGGVCQYCGKKKHMNEMNIEHVLPQAQGGKTSWKNVVLSCIKCNHKKGNRTPEQAGMKLLRKPQEPHWALVEGRSKMEMPTSWRDFIDKMYWNVELDAS